MKKRSQKTITIDKYSKKGEKEYHIFGNSNIVNCYYLI